MKTRFNFLLLFLAWLELLPLHAYGARLFHLHATDSKIEVLSEQAFEEEFGHESRIPRTDKGVIALARKIVARQLDDVRGGTFDERPMPPGDHSEEYLMAALQNPQVSDAVRHRVDSILASAIPDLPAPPHYTDNFEFRYTTNDRNPVNNSTLADIEAAGALMEKFHALYTQHFREPQHIKVDNVKQRIIIKVYYLGKGEFGKTGKDWPYILFNSVALASSCDLRLMAAHELFHRVQYMYGAPARRAERDWFIEGTATWAEKFTSPRLLLYKREMNTGLNAPKKGLTERAYDSVHLWIYLEEQLGWPAIREFWTEYERTQNARTALRNVVGNFDKFLHKWHKANIIKDFSNAPAEFDYADDETISNRCGKYVGPLVHVPRDTMEIAGDDDHGIAADALAPYGASYHLFTLGPAVSSLRFEFKGMDGGSFSSCFLLLKNNNGTMKYQTFKNSYVYNHSQSPKEWDTLVIMVMGRDKGGAYTISFGPPDFQVHIPDPLLQSTIRAKLNKPTGDIYRSELATISWLSASVYPDSKITNLSGMEYCSGMNGLRLGFQRITDLKPLRGLNRLVLLDLESNPDLSDISPVSSLVNMQKIFFNHTKVRDITPIVHMKQLQVLDLGDTGISDISPVAANTALAELYLNTYDSRSGGNVVNIQALAGLKNLNRVGLYNNPGLLDISPLVRNTGMGEGDSVDLLWTGLDPNCETRLGDTTDCDNVRALRARGVRVDWKPTP
jgi:hypothetical protein